MSRRRAAARIGCAALVGVLGLAGCGDKDNAKVRALAALRATQALPRHFRFEEKTVDALVASVDATAAAKGGGSSAQAAVRPGHDLVVDGSIEDDLRYGATVSVDGAPVLEQRVLDDAIAVRVAPGAPLPEATGVGSSSVPAGQPGAGAVPEAALHQGRWILDPTGAPKLLSAKQRGGPVASRDVVQEADRYLGSVVAFANAGFQVKQFNEEDLEYKPREDPFPKPNKGAGEVRYDVVRPFLPVPASAGGGAGGGGQQRGTQLPSATNFRKLSVYVRDGKVERVLERVALDERADQTVRLLDTILAERRLPDVTRKQVVKQLDTATGQAKEQQIVTLLNSLDPAAEPIVLRTVELDVSDLGAAITVAAPDDPVQGDLSRVFAKRDAAGRPVEEGGDKPGATGSTTTTTTAASGT